MPNPIKQEDIDGVVDNWFNASIATGAIARNTEAYNQASAARDELKKNLGKLLGDPPTPADKLKAS